MQPEMLFIYNCQSSSPQPPLWGYQAYVQRYRNDSEMLWQMKWGAQRSRHCASLHPRMVRPSARKQELANVTQCGNETGAPGTSLFTFCFSFQPKFWSLARFLHQEHRGNTLKQFNTSTRQRRYNAPWRKFLLHHFWTKQWASFYFSLYVQATDTFCRCCKRFYSTKGHRPSPPAQDSGVDELWNDLNLCLVILH